MGQIKMDSAERGVMELKRHLLESEVKLNKPTLEQLIMYGVLTREKAQEVYVSTDVDYKSYFEIAIFILIITSCHYPQCIPLRKEVSKIPIF